MSSYTSTETSSFTITHARYIASKVATDLKRFQRFYGSPSDDWIDRYEGELAGLLKHDAVENVVYGFQRNSLWTPASVRYRAIPGGSLIADDDPGKIRPGIDITGARFTSFLSYSTTWFDLTPAERESIESSLPIQRTHSSAPALETGAWSDDLSYSAGGRGLGRSSVRT
ncbi:hypothetical protein AB0V79_24280 [Mesorhizobium ciceri]|uniref:HORMA-1 domain-containing protein n=1 Tax=Mesorhizobium TaxID=68287 RepID=UPI0007A94BD3|nr:hypothetical protein [Mesorhizobium ciceri]AMX98798.1 hypothetical protein A4R29_04170 [Mesorhizobium ciceri biovar biserrulae]